MNRIFVYGTLKRGCKNHHHLATQAYVGEARTAPGYRLHDLGDYPGMVADPTSREGVTGELWDVAPAALAHLDAFEGIEEGLYRRVAVPIVDFPGCTEAFAYLYARNPEGFSLIGPTWRE